METATVVPSPATWLPQDDFLLKNAIEEGASMEALAKGAVHFSHTFTVQEVHDRWHALLYNPDISAQACAHLFLDESDKSKEINASHRKRKVGSLRKRYSAMLKRIRHELFSSPDLGFVIESTLHGCTANGSDLHEQGTLHDGPQVGNAILEHCITDPFEVPKTDFDRVPQVLPQILADLSTANGVSNADDAFHLEGLRPLFNRHISGTAKNDCLHAFPSADSPFAAQGSIRIDGMPPFHLNNNGGNDIVLRSLQADSTETGKCLLPGGELSCTNAYTMRFSPPLSSMSLWKRMEDISASDMQVNVETVQNVSEFPGNDDRKSKSAAKQNGDSFIDSVSISDGDFLDLPDSLFDFSNDDLLFMDVDGKTTIDKSGCDNTLSDVPIDMDAIDSLKVGEEAMMVANAAIATELEVVTHHLHGVVGEEKPVSHVKVQTSSASTLNNKPHELGDSRLYCALNTEDPEIPCNDDIFLLIHPEAPYAASAVTSVTKSAKVPVSVKETNSVQRLNLVKPSQMFGSYLLPETGQFHTGSGPIIKAESNDTCKDLALRCKAVVDPIQCKPAQTNIASAADANLDKDVKKDYSQAADTLAILSELPLHAETDPVEITHPELVVNPPTSDQESENEDPHFSDIEAMILDMDLCSYDDDFHFTWRVSKYQQENSKRKIMRLEQCAQSSIQRAMTSQGAFAVLYGRHSRHFIRKTEVILGRSTEETVVDIDLGKEGCHNKISRRQAILKMENDGSFALKNLAKNPILVNGAEIGTGELIGLSLSCLIEIRGISFVFESNQNYIKRYLENIRKKNQGQMANFEWIPKEEVAMS